MSRLREHPLKAGFLPSWAWGLGHDRYGVFTEIKIGKVVQRMRWIFPGTFRMGSPESEAGRFNREGPQHELRFTQGFWLADTPCNQQMWQEVMGETPSRYPSPARPVEQVSWEDCQRFFEKAEERQPDLELRLPTEAQWEYACRAGTEGATWVGDLEILGERNAPRLDDIAWYGGNSGVELDLEEGWGTSNWKEQQYPNDRAGTRIVKEKRPNPWGLYDILGNVYEWCADAWSLGDKYPEEDPRIDPVGMDGWLRVTRGGSWASHARSVRAAFRSGLDPGSRRDNVGFRLSRGP